MPRSAQSKASPDSAIRLVVVESPAKAKTIAGYLGDGFVVEASIGHVRDLPRNAADIPAKYKGESWARLGVDVNNNFAPLYVISPDRKSQVSKLKDLIKQATELYLATDEDREGEAIAWHLVEILRPKVPVRRMVFHEITRSAIESAVNNPRQLNQDLVDAQETRRILDRLYGYEVSPVLWKKVMPKLSAGRVQSVATRIVVERERARMQFTTAGYWDLEGVFSPADSDRSTFSARLSELDGSKVASSKDFDPLTGQLQSSRSGVLWLDENQAVTLAGELEQATWHVDSVEEKPYRRKPYPPFMTSTLQQEASRKLRMTAQTAMRVAQRLYENGYITYMRTDSTNLAESAVAAARAQARSLYGDSSVPTKPRLYSKKAKNAQEAHEAIRPSGDHFRTPRELSSHLSADELRLYELIWMRTVASQMIDATGTSVSVKIVGDSVSGHRAVFAASGTTITEPGFLRAYDESVDEAEPDKGRSDSQNRLPQLSPEQQLNARSVQAQGHHTQPPARYTEASLVKSLEELGIGRPSTYASILQTIQDRGYVWKKSSALVPSFIAFAVVNLLEQHFSRLVDYDFTAKIEEDLDAIAGGEQGSIDWLTRFYFAGTDDREGGIAQIGGLQKLVADKLSDIDAKGINSIALYDDVVVRVGRYGPYLQRGGDEGQRVSLTEDIAPDELTSERVEELFSIPTDDRELGNDPESGRPIVAKVGRYGPYVTEILPDDAPKSAKPRTSSLFKTMSLETVTLVEALKLLQLPRLVGKTPDGEEITAHNGRYGPYIKKDKESRTLEGEEQLFTVTLDEALALLAQPKTRGRQSASTAPLREIGPDPVTGKQMIIKDGRFGPYVTDGEVNASLRKADTVDGITAERAAELLADRRAKGVPAKRSNTRKSPAKPKSTKSGKNE